VNLNPLLNALASMDKLRFDRENLDSQALSVAEIDIKYAAYVEKELAHIERIRQMEIRTLRGIAASRLPTRQYTKKPGHRSDRAFAVCAAVSCRSSRVNHGSLTHESCLQQPTHTV
jgi:hypothetical protein